MALAVARGRPAIWLGMHAEPVDPRSRNPAPGVLVYPYGIVVDSTGKRFFDEGGGLVHETWETFARTIHFATPGRIAYAVLDAKLYDIDGYQRAIRSAMPPHQANRIPELGTLIGVPAEALQETVARYNAAATGVPAHGRSGGRPGPLAVEVELVPAARPAALYCLSADRCDCLYFRRH